MTDGVALGLKLVKVKEDPARVFMLPPFIIEQIRQREEQQRWDERPVLELPLDDLSPRRERGNEKPRGEQTVERGVLIIDL